MNEGELKRMLEAGETDTIEFKSVPNDSFYEGICAFANTRGGTILLGVDRNGNVVGVDSSSEFLEQLTSRIVNKLSVYPDIETLDIGGRRVIVNKISSLGYAVSYEGRYYERVGNTTREMNTEKLKALLLRGKRWDSMTNDFASEEIDDETIRRFLKLAIDKKRIPDLSSEEPVPVVLEKLGLVLNGKITNGAMLLFGKNPQKYFVNLCVRIGRLKGETTIIDDKWAKGNLFSQFEETLAVLRQHMSVRYEIKGMQREDIWDYPIPALREALLNALVHRDYFDVANFIQIKVYDDHMWFFSHGGLPEGITIQELKKPHSSHLRNPLIAKVFYLAGYTEQYGSGTVRMVEWMREAGLPEPEYREEMGGFSVYFYKDIYTEENMRKSGLSERQIKAVMYVKEKGKITNKEYQEICEVKKRQATDDLKGLEDKEILKRVGITGKGTYYIIKGRQRGETGNKGAPKGQEPHERRTKGARIESLEEAKNPKRKGGK